MRKIKFTLFDSKIHVIHHSVIEYPTTEAATKSARNLAGIVDATRAVIYTADLDNVVEIDRINFKEVAA
jgi:hypothetical protein